MIPKLMGILNITPDSFSDGGKFRGKTEAIAHAYKMMEEGADILDVGGESTRPGAECVSLQEELDRVMPVLEEIVKWDVDISIDTSKYEVAREALRLGVNILNDVSGLQFDSRLADLAAEFHAKLIIMHMRGIPKTMQENLESVDIIERIQVFFEEQTKLAVTRGVNKNNIILDPGIGFGKTVDDNIKILKHIDRFRALGFPVLIGASRKSMIGAITGAEVNHRLPGSLAVACVAAQRGAEIIRIHDVAETVQALKMIEKIW
jgi:dihydropteroate synthase